MTQILLQIKGALSFKARRRVYAPLSNRSAFKLSYSAHKNVGKHFVSFAGFLMHEFFCSLSELTFEVVLVSRYLAKNQLLLLSLLTEKTDFHGLKLPLHQGSPLNLAYSLVRMHFLEPR